jgi:phosphate acetyltransferase
VNPGDITIPSVQNKTFDEIRVGDTASVQRTLHARDARAWAAAFGDVDPVADASDVQDPAGIITAILTSLVGSALPGPGSSIRSTAVQVHATLPINGVLAAKLIVREKRADERLCDTQGRVAGILPDIEE